MNQENSRTGFYGKLSSHGDFLSRRLSPTFVRCWDDWLQAGLHFSCERLGAQWQATYLSSPIWHFALAGGICGEPGWAGILMPSVDRVGRYFPLTIAYGGPNVPVIDRLSRDAPWYSDVERLALSSLEVSFSLELFDRALSSLPAPSRIPSLAPKSALGKAFCTLRLEGNEQEAPNVNINQWTYLLSRATEGQSLEGHSLFWSEGASSMPPSLLLCPGLPTMQMFVEMLAGTKACSTAMSQRSVARQAGF
nr:type VI secretion system-associated protein TagF [uncultured Pseudomonas sp.]